MTAEEPPGKTRGVIESAFFLLDLVAELQPVRLVDLSAAAAMPHPTVHRLLRQLVDVGAIRRDGSRYALGASLLRLGANVTPAARLRVASRRPMAELAAVTGAAVSLSADLGDGPVYLDTLDARSPARFVAKEGDSVPPETAQGRAHARIASAAPVVDAGHVAVDHSCIAMRIAFGSSQGVAVVSTLIAAPQPPAQMLGATRWAAGRIAESLRT
jgi:hypothetical protein